MIHRVNGAGLDRIFFLVNGFGFRSIRSKTGPFTGLVTSKEDVSYYHTYGSEVLVTSFVYNSLSSTRSLVVLGILMLIILQNFWLVLQF
ncbi:hypothetical protein RchiOBHm_Chr7g0196821 [Rosa chinensis]|uniref:Uncharacterized protein n=1 Tax=Rosa chinensis TaxID=74649 RepID=A0A2P6P6R1_ROSCH|nr:hypothetical protein RchiOBHm_Chr7g0196821 [Rosa chinensis]